jgi:hypothetical protein
VVAAVAVANSLLVLLKEAVDLVVAPTVLAALALHRLPLLTLAEAAVVVANLQETSALEALEDLASLFSAMQTLTRSQILVVV